MAHQPRQTTFRGLDVTKMAGRRVSAPVPEKRAPPADSDDNFLSHSPSKRARVSIGNVVFESRAEVLEVAIGDRPRRPEQRLMKFSASQGSVAAKMLNVRAEQNSRSQPAPRPEAFAMPGPRVAVQHEVPIESSDDDNQDHEENVIVVEDLSEQQNRAHQEDSSPDVKDEPDSEIQAIENGARNGFPRPFQNNNRTGARAQAQFLGFGGQQQEQDDPEVSVFEANLEFSPEEEHGQHDEQQQQQEEPQQHDEPPQDDDEHERFVDSFDVPIKSEMNPEKALVALSLYFGAQTAQLQSIFKDLIDHNLASDQRRKDMKTTITAKAKEVESQYVKLKAKQDKLLGAVGGMKSEMED